MPVEEKKMDTVDYYTVVKAMRDGEIRIIDCPYEEGLYEPVCAIDGGWFYFVDDEESGMSAEEYLAEHDPLETAGEIYTILKNEDTAEKNGISEEEYQYYLDVLLP